MLDRLIDWSLGHRTAVVVGAVLIAVLGFLSFRSLPIEAFPDVTDTQVQVITLFPGHAPEEVERLVLEARDRIGPHLLETALHRYPFVDELTGSFWLGVPSPAAAQAGTLNTKPVGAGPYQLDSYEESQTITLKKNPHAEIVELGVSVALFIGLGRLNAVLGIEPGGA